MAMTLVVTRPQKGFTLIEMAVAVFIIALLLGSILVPLTTQVEQKQISDSQRMLDDIKESLMGYALTNGYIPCPDTNNDGAEDVVVGTGLCGTIVGGIASGNIPWTTLGILSNTDPWGNRFRYVINERYARRSPGTPITLSGGGTDVRICATAACATTLSTTAAAAILSLGKNGYGATNGAGGTNAAPSSADEIENLDTDRDVVSRIPTAVGAAAGEFDDIVTWLSSYVLFNRMVSAGKLP
jgi:prepilin-type N-terminal cleavage/methylation domain-containing protein